MQLRCSEEDRRGLLVPVGLSATSSQHRWQGCQRDFKRLLNHRSELKLKLSLTKRPFRGNRKAYVLLEERWSLKLLKATHIRIRWVSCRVLRKKVLDQCYHCPGFGHICGELSRAWSKQELLEVRQRRTHCGVLFKETAVLPLRRKRR